LPQIARDALAPSIVQNLMPLADQAADAPVEIVINPAAQIAVQALLAQAGGPPTVLICEPSLGDGQAFLRLGQNETRIDLDGAIGEIAAAVQGFFQLPERTQPHD
jgi:flagellar assembly protein FliH